jgi:SsrA-binding protein
MACAVFADARNEVLNKTREVGKEKISNNVTIKNKRATFDYELLETFTAGIVLTGTEIKSIRLGKASLVDTYCIIERSEVWLKNMYVAEYFYGTYNNHSERRERKLLLNRKEIRKLETAAKNSGFTIIPTRLFINDKGLVKIVIAIAKGKKEYDKRVSIRERDDKREMDRAFKH